MGSIAIQMPGRLEPLCCIVTPVGMLGYGFDEAEVHQGLQHGQKLGVPTALILDSGSTDSGPNKLALGEMSVPRENYKRDLEKLVRILRTFRVPLIIGSAGGDGSDAHVREFTKIITEILELPENEYGLRSIFRAKPLSWLTLA